MVRRECSHHCRIRSGERAAPFESSMNSGDSVREYPVGNASIRASSQSRARPVHASSRSVSARLESTQSEIESQFGRGSPSRDSSAFGIVASVICTPDDLIAHGGSGRQDVVTSGSVPVWPPCGDVQELDSFSLARHAGTSQRKACTTLPRRERKNAEQRIIVPRVPQPAPQRRGNVMLPLISSALVLWSRCPTSDSVSHFLTGETAGSR